ncbi:hypothetical protein Tco_1244827 [Tanacetum coccineum]
MLAPSGGGLILYQAYGNLYAMTGRKVHLLEDKQIPSVGVFDEVFSIWKAFGENTRDLGSFGEETDKTTNLHQHLSRISTQKLEAASQITRDAITTHLKTASQDLQTAHMSSSMTGMDLLQKDKNKANSDKTVYGNGMSTENQSQRLAMLAIPSNLIGYETWHMIQGLRMNGLEAVWIEGERLKAWDAPRGSGSFPSSL